MKNKGFTLVELLAVIVILAIILAIAIPTISSLINDSKAKAMASDAKLLLKQLEYKTLENSSFDITSIDETSATTLGLSGDNYQDLIVSAYQGKPYVYIIGKNKWDGYIACGVATDMKIVTTANISTCSNSANSPELATGMTPIKWVNGVETTTTISDSNWYNYENKIWANAKTQDGSYWVWIPRYAYKIATGYQSTTAGNIDVKFLNGTTNVANDGTTPVVYSNGNSATNYVLHPAFNFGGTQVSGIWVAKFEASKNGSSKIKVAPNVTAWINSDVGVMYNSSRAMETDIIYGWDNTGINIDTHLIKNIEWGAVAYLSKSNFGKSDEVWVNNSSTFTTGCAGSSISASSYSGCQFAYNTTNGGYASTTGNISGVYDMSGSTYEYVMGVLDNLAASSGITPSSIPDKYIDRYSSTINYSYNNTYYGDAYFETSSSVCVNNICGNSNGAWYSGRSYAPYSARPWFIRGGNYSNGLNSGIFAYYNDGDVGYSDNGFRPVLIVASGI